MKNITPSTIRAYVKELEKKGYAHTEIVTKLQNVGSYIEWAYEQDQISYKNFQQIKDEIAKQYSSYNNKGTSPEPQEAQELIPASTPALTDFEKAEYAGHKETDGIAGSFNFSFRLETYKLKQWLRGIVDRVPLLGSHMSEKAGKRQAGLPSNQYTSDAELKPTIYIGFAVVMIVLAILGAGIYDRFIRESEQSLAFPADLTSPSTRFLSFQGRLTDSLGNPITTATDMQFRLYDASSGGSTLYDSTTCSITPDQDGVHNVLIGEDCGSSIENDVFTENAEVWLGVKVGSDSEMTPRQQIANVAYALNAETLQGFPAGTGASTIPYISSAGELIMATTNPTLHSSYASETFTVSSANALTLQSAGSGDITLAATGSAQLVFQATGDTDDYIYFDTDSNNAQILFEGYTANDPGLRLNASTNELEYRDNNDSGWTAFTDISTSPGGSDTQLQYNDNGNFGGISAITYNDSTLETTITDDLTLSLSGTENLDISSAMDGSTGNIVRIAATPSLSSPGPSPHYALYIDQVSEATDNDGLTAAIAIDNSDGDEEIVDGILFIDAGGGFTDYIDTPSSVFKVDGSGNVTGVGGTFTADVAVNGGDLTSSQSTFNLLNATPTTLNIGGAATTVELGASSGTTSVNNALTIDGNTTLGNGSGDSVTSNASTWTFANDTTVALSGGVNGLNFDSNTLSIDAANDRIGIGTAAPDAAWLDIAAATTSKAQINLTSSAATDVSSPNSGDLWWNGTNLYFHDGSVDNDLLAGGSSTNYWQLNSNVLAPGNDATVTDALVLGGNTTTNHLFDVTGAVTGKALILFDEEGDQNILTASNSGTTRLNLTNAGQLELKTDGSSAGITIGAGDDITLYHDGTDSILSTSTGDWNFTATDDFIFTDAQVTNIQLSDADTTLPNSNTGIVDAINDAYDAAVGGGGGLWTDSSTTTYLTTTTDDLVLGGTSPLSSAKFSIDGDSDQIQFLVQASSGQSTNLLQFENSGGTDLAWFDESGNLRIGSSAADNGKLNVTGADTGKALAIFNETGDQDILVASAGGTTRFRVANDGAIYGGYLADISNNTYGIDPAGTSNFGGNSLRVTGGSLLAEDSGQVGINTSSTNASLDVGGGTADFIDGTDDLLVADDVEIDGDLYVAGGIDTAFTEGSIVFAGSNGLLTEDNTNFFWDDTDNKLGIGDNTPDGKLVVSGAATGKALAMFNETGDQDILVASASGTNRLRLSNEGNLSIGTNTASIASDSSLRIDATHSSPSTNILGIDINLNATGFSGSNSFTGLDITADLAATGATTGSLYGGIVNATYDGATGITLDESIGFAGVAFNDWDLTTNPVITKSTALQGSLVNLADITTGYVVEAAIHNQTALNTATITDLSLFGSTSGTMSGAITNLYGLKLTDWGTVSTSVTNSYGIYVNENIAHGTNHIGAYISTGKTDGKGIVLQEVASQTENVFEHQDSDDNNQIVFTAGGGAIFNEEGNDSDFRVEGTGAANALFVQGSDGYVGIGDNTPAAFLDIGGGTATSIDGTDDLLVADDAEIDGDLYVEGDATAAGGTFGNIQVGVTGDNEIDTSSGNLTLDSAGGTTTVDDTFAVTGDTTLTGDLAVNGDDITSDGNLTINATGYTRIGDSATPGSANGDDDLYVQGDLEVDAALYLDGSSITSSQAINWNLPSSTTALTFETDLLGLDTSNDGIDITTGATTTDVLDITADSLTTGYGLDLSFDGLTTGTGLYLASTSTSLDTTTAGGSLGYFEWAPGSSDTVATDLFTINIGANGNVDNLFNITDAGSSVFRVSETVVESAVPASFTSAGDVSFAYDINLTNQTSSYIDSNAPLYIRAGESFESNDLTLNTYNSGDIVLNAGDSTSGTGTISFYDSNIKAATVTTAVPFAETSTDINDFRTNFTDESVIGALNELAGGGSSPWTDGGSYIFTTNGEVLNLGGVTGLGYHAISDSGGTSHSLASDDDLYVEGDFEVDGTFYADGAFEVDGNVTLGDAASDTVTFNADVASHLLPSSDDNYDLGASASRWRDLYLGPQSLHIGTSGNEAIIGYDTTSNWIEFNPSGDGSEEATLSDAGTLTLVGDLAVNGDDITTDGDLTIDAAGNDIITENKVTIGSVDPGHAQLTVDGSSSTGALVIFDQDGSENIFVASDSGTGKFSIGQQGDISRLGSSAISALPDQGSIAPNASFELDNDGDSYPDDWADNSGTATYNTTGGGHGEAYLTIGAGGSDIIESTCFPISSSQSYTLSMRTRNLIGSANQAVIYLYYATTRSNCESGTFGGSVNSGILNVVASWAGRGATATATSTTARWGIIRIQNFSVSNQLDVDGIRVTPSTTNTGLDIAENFPVDPKDKIEPGHIVGFGKGLVEQDVPNVKKSKNAYDKNIFGVVATQPGITLDDDGNYPKVAVALAGRVPVQVTSENGPIKVGDAITASSLPGIGMKSTKPGRVIGRAMTEWDHDDPSELGVITVFVEPGYDAGYLLTELQKNLKTVPQELREIIVTDTAKIASVVAKTIKAVSIETQKLVADTIDVTNAEIDRLIVDKITSQNINSKYINTTGLTAKDITTDSLKTDSLEAAAINAETIDTDSLTTGNLQAENLEGKDASFSGTLVADAIDSQNIRELRDRLERVALEQSDVQIDSSALTAEVEGIQEYINNLENEATISPDAFAQVEQEVGFDPGSIASINGDTISQINVEKLIVTGEASMTSLVVADDFAAGNIMVQDNTLLSLNHELKLSALDTVNILDGAVVIAKDGTITAKGEVIAEKGVQTSEVTVKDFETGEIVAGIDASGSARFKDIALETFTTATDSASVIAAPDNYQENRIFAPAIKTNAEAAGNGVLPKFNDEVVIYNDKITPTSLIYVSATSNTKGKQLFVSDQIACNDNTSKLTPTPGPLERPCKPYFMVALDGAINQDVHFNWWIVN